MTINKRRGFIRLGVIACVVWCVGWGLLATAGNQRINSALTELDFIKKTAAVRDDTYWRMVTDLTRNMNKGSAMVETAVLWGIGVPLLLLVATPFVWWIYRGFKPRERLSD